MNEISLNDWSDEQFNCNDRRHNYIDTLVKDFIEREGIIYTPAEAMIAGIKQCHTYHNIIDILSYKNELEPSPQLENVILLLKELNTFE